jgi:hypothetical protein
MNRSLGDCKLIRVSPGLSVRGSGFLNPRERFSLQLMGFSPGENVSSPPIDPKLFVTSTTAGSQSGLEREIRTVCVVTSVAVETGRAATRAKARD